MRWAFTLLISCFTAVTGNALAEPPETPKVFIQNIRLFTSWDSSANVDRTQVPIFKQLLEQYGYQTDNCKASREGLRGLLDRASPQKPDSYDRVAKRERLIAAVQCQVPEEGVNVFDAELVLDVDPVLKNRRAVLRFVPIGGGTTVSGGYAHKPGELASWYDMVNRAIERTMEGFNEPTAISLVLPEDTTVGDTLRLDGRTSWDPDGDAFELRWNVTTKGCIGSGRPLPVDKRPCPGGTAKGSVKIQDQAGMHDFTREFRVPMIGDYEVRVHSKVGAREETDRIYRIRAYPRRSSTFFSRVGYLMLPTDFLHSSGQRDPALLIGLGYLHRIAHRVGLFGFYEDVHLGLSLDTIQMLDGSGFRGKSGALLGGVEVLARLMDRTGRYGIAEPISLSGGYTVAERGDYLESEAIVRAETMIGGYYAFGENYRDKPTAYCGKVCPGVTLGPTLALLGNVTTSKIAVVLGVQIVMGVEF